MMSSAEIIPKRKWQYPLAIEREYAKYLAAYIDKEAAVIESFLPEMAASVYRNRIRVDGFGDWLGNLVDKIQRKVSKAVSAVPVLGRVFGQVDKHVAHEMSATMDSVYGRKPRNNTMPRELEMLQTIWTSQNLTLIKSVDQQLMDKVRFALSQKVISATDKEKTIAELTQEIQDITGAAKKRATLIAVDQVGKLHSQLTQYRQKALGIERYMWRTMRDSRVRMEHRARDGNIYEWNNPPSGGHPGMAIRCRCTADPVLDTGKFALVPKRNSFIYLPEDGTIKPDRVLASSEKIPRVFEPNGVIDSVNAKGHVYRTFYGADGIMVRQIHSDDHGNPKHHPYGEHGEHTHDYVWNSDGTKQVDRRADNLTPQERKENGDLLWWQRKK